MSEIKHLTIGQSNFLAIKNQNMHRFSETTRRLCLAVGFGFTTSLTLITAAEPSTDATVIRVGIIGLDTSHSPALVKTFNDPKPKNQIFHGVEVVAAYPFGSQTIPSSADRIPQYTRDVQSRGVEIVDSIDALLAMVDCVCLETNDGGLHLDQALQVFRASKPVFIDKPTGAILAQTIAIFRAAEQHDVPMFSASSLRYTPGAQAIRGGAIGEVLGCSTYSPFKREPSHVDLFWYGIHGVEALYTCMGPGCQSVRHLSTDVCQISTGQWDHGRIGIMRGIESGKSGYGGTAFGKTGIADIGNYGGYEPLFVQIAEFFVSRQPPIEAAETIEIYAFMQAAAASQSAGGKPVTLAEVMAEATTEADRLLAGQ